MNELLTRYKYWRYKHGVAVRNDLLYGYKACVENIELDELGRAIKILRDQELSGTICICEEEVERIKALFIQEIGIACGNPPLDYSVEDRNDPQWLLQNPDCVSYDHWVDVLAAECEKIGLNLNARIKACPSDVDLDVVLKDACTTVDVMLEIEKRHCDVQLELTVEQINQCKVDFDILITPLNCNVSFETVVTALKCGATVELVAKALLCGATVSVTAGNVDYCFPAEEGVNCCFGAAEPTIGCPADASYPCIEDIPAASVDDIVSFTVNDCGAPVFDVVDVQSEESCAIERTFSITDGCGNVAECVQIFTVEDDELPVIVECAADVTIECGQDPDDLELTGVPEVSDNCAGATGVIFITFPAFSDPPCEINLTRIWQAVDACGNANPDTCIQTITILDTTPPVITFCPPDVTIECGEPLPTTLATAVDGCSEVEISYEDDLPVGDCPMVITRTHYAEDECGNVSSCEQIITIADE